MTLEQLGMWRSTGALGRGGVWTGGEPHEAYQLVVTRIRWTPILGAGTWRVHTSGCLVIDSEILLILQIPLLTFLDYKNKALEQIWEI